MSGGAFFERITHPTSNPNDPVIIIKDSVMDRIDNWMGSLLYRGQSIEVIKEMDYRELKYWGEWCDVFKKSAEDALKGL